MFGLGELGEAPSYCQPGFVGPLSTEEQTTCASYAAGYSAGMSNAPNYQTVTTAAGDYQIIGGQIFDPSGKQVSSIPGASPFGLSTPVLIAGAVLIAVLMFSGGRR